MLHGKDYTYTHFHSLELKATFYSAQSNVKDKTILYFHGGGLIYGQRNDLPEPYIQTFLDNGYHFLAFDYPLAPETPLVDIYSQSKKGLLWFMDHYKKALGIESNDFILFGRSAGAYLTLLLSYDKELPKPEKIISFYGYPSLTAPSLSTKNAFYQKYPAVPEMLVKKMIGSTPLADGPLQTRYALYLYGRQTGKWLDLLGISSENKGVFSLTEENLAELPPTFIAHSHDDQDVPYTIGEQLHATIPYSYFYSVSNLEHDFDRDPTVPQAKEAYQKLIDWLE